MLTLALISTLAVAQPQPPEVDVLVVPGCPTAEDGAIGRCLASRVAWAERLYREGVAENIIVTGAAVYTPWVEAEIMAAALAELSVPADRIWLEPHAMHTDENMYNALRIAQEQGWETLAVASHHPHARTACRQLESWGATCTPKTMDMPYVWRAVPRQQEALAALDVARQPGWVGLEERELDRAEEKGQERRPSSFVLYRLGALHGLLGIEDTLPYSPSATPAALTWKQMGR
jgi:vancomycin permeability regulator SanA